MSDRFKDWINLAQPRLGTRVVGFSDEFFGAAERMLKPELPVFIPDKYDEHGKWMDGWETRRRRRGGHDWAVVDLGAPGRIKGFDIDTSFFTGNYPPEVEVEAAHTEDGPWVCLSPRQPIRGDSHNELFANDEGPWRWLRLHLHPDGGVARFRVFGQVAKTAAELKAAGLIDLAAIENGGRALDWNDQHYGAVANLIAPGEAVNMGDGWETRRRREPGHDWAVLALGCTGSVRHFDVNTMHFKGNYPDRCSIEGARVESDCPGREHLAEANWEVLLDERELGAHATHRFDAINDAPVNVIRLNIFPDGGISRLRVWGEPC